MADPNTGKVSYYDNPGQRAIAYAKQEQAGVQPTVAALPDAQIPSVNDDGSQPVDQPARPFFVPQKSAPAPVMATPTFQQASTDANGMPVAVTPGLTKVGKLVQVLGLAAKGAMAGQAASEQAVTQSGGHRGGGVGMGFQAGMLEPAREAMEHAEVQRGGLQNQTTQMALDQARTPVDVGNGTKVPFWMAQRNATLSKTIADANKDRYVTPRNGGVYDTSTGQYAAGTEPQDKHQNQSPQQLLADAVADAQRRGVDPSSDPKVKQIQDVITAGNNKPDTGTEITQRFQQTVGKLLSNGELPEGVMSDVNKLSRAITSSKSLSAQEKSDAIGYLAAHPTPASTGTNAVIRLEGLGQTRTQNVVDSKHPELGVQPITIDEIHRAQVEEPGRYRSAQYDPNTQASVTTAKAGASDFTKGKGADQKQSFNTFVGHAGDLSDAVDGMRLSDSPLINKPLNWLRQNAAGDPQIQAYLAKIDPPRKEFETFLLNNHALSEADKQQAAAILNENLSPAAMQAAIKSFAHTAAIRMGALNDRYKAGHNGQNDSTLLSDDSANILRKLGEGAFVDKYYNSQSANAPSKSKGSGSSKKYPGVRFTPLQ